MCGGTRTDEKSSIRSRRWENRPADRPPSHFIFNATERTHNFPFAEETSEENKIVINQLVDTSESRVSYRIDDI
jgi:hypothetical protein